MDELRGSVGVSAVNHVLQAGHGVEVIGPCVARFLVRVALGSADAAYESVFVEVFDRGDAVATGQRYVGWVFSCHGFPLLAGVPVAEISEVHGSLNWRELRAKLSVGMYR